MGRDLSDIVKAYDVRGLVPEQLDRTVAEALGAAFARFCDAPKVVVAHDMRASSRPLATAFEAGVMAQGVDVVDAGLGSTDLLYYASGSLGLPGVMFTASHNPARYNGLKLCRAGAVPIGQDSGLADIRRLAEEGVPAHEGPSGSVEQVTLVEEYADHLRGLVPGLADLRPLRVVVDAANGMAGLTAPTVLGTLDLEVEPMYFDLDGEFPNHEANPIDPANLRDLQAKVRESGADIGLAFDGDADRCFVVDERGEIVSPSVLTALIASRELLREPGSVVIHNLITSKAVPEVVRENGGTPVRTRVGHSFIKATMAETDAVFGGEHSGHFYFRDFWRADSGMLAALHVLAALGEADRPLSQLLAEFSRYAASGEVNSEVTDPPAVMERLAAEYGSRDGITTDTLDGLTVDSSAGWWFNVRPSNTEPLLRLNVEAPDEPTMVQVRDEVLSSLRS